MVNEKNFFLFILKIFIKDFFIKSKEFHLENHDRSVSISINNKTIFQVIFFTLSNIKTHQLINSRIVNLNLMSKDKSIDNIHITFRHLNQTNQIPTCVYLKNNEK